MSFVTDLQDHAEYYGGDYRELPPHVRNDLIASYVRAQPVLEPVYELPNRTIDYLLRDTLADLIEHSHNAQGQKYQQALNALIGGLVLGVAGAVEKRVEELYDTETAPTPEYPTASEWVEVRG